MACLQLAPHTHVIMWSLHYPPKAKQYIKQLNTLTVTVVVPEAPLLYSEKAEKVFLKQFINQLKKNKNKIL